MKKILCVICFLVFYLWRKLLTLATAFKVDSAKIYKKFQFLKYNKKRRL